VASQPAVAHQLAYAVAAWIASKPHKLAWWMVTAARRSVPGGAGWGSHFGHELRQLTAAGIPVVVIDPAEEPGADIRSVGTTNWQGGLSATRHLIELGHRRIASIGGPPHL
jgi:hypothetical protein